MFRLVVGSLLLTVALCNSATPWTLAKGADGFRIASFHIRYKQKNPKIGTSQSDQVSSLQGATDSAVLFVLVSFRSGSGMDDVYNLSRTAEAIRMMNVDLIGLQEVDQYTDRHPLDDQVGWATIHYQGETSSHLIMIFRGLLTQPKKLAMLTGLTHYVFGKFRDFENGSYGVAILSRYPIERSQVFHFQKPSGNSPSHVRQLLHADHHHHHAEKESLQFQDRRRAECAVPKEGDYCQGAVAIQINTGEQRIWFATTHLGISNSFQLAT